MITLRSGGWVRLLCVGFLLLFPVLAGGKTLTVSAGDKTTLGSVLAAANPGDVVLVGCGDYFEGAMVLPDGVTLSGATGDASCVRIMTSGLVALISCMDAGPTTLLANLTLTVQDGGFAWPVPRGAGVYLQNSSPVFSNVIFEGLEADYGGAVYCMDGSDPSFQGCVFKGNYARAIGGAVSVTDNSSPSFDQCLFVDNVAESSGGAINVALGSGSSLVGCTIVRGSAKAGSAIASWDAGVSMENVIVADGEGGRAWYGDALSAPVPVCTDLFGNGGGDWVGALAAYESSGGNMSADPGFCGAADSDNPYSLYDTSPCAPAGNPGCDLIGAYGVGCNYVSEVPDGGNGLPSVSRLHPNYPNPFNPRTTIKFDLKQDGPVELAVFDIAGRLVKSLVRDSMSAGHHEAVWQGKDASGRTASAGVYFFRLKTRGTIDTKRMTLIK